MVNALVHTLGHHHAVVNREIAAEAALWVARLHGPARSARLERECKAWLAHSDAHRLAFERCTEVWQEVPGLSLADAFAAQPPGDVMRAAHRSRWRWATVAVLAATVLLGGVYQWVAPDQYATEVSEYRQVVLGDGSRLRLNTATRVQVTMDARQRTVDVEAGEALFEVARDPTLPFVVRAGGHEVRALGTVFSVKLMPTGAVPLSVTLMEGKVAINAVSSSGTLPSPLVLAPGDRAQFATTPGQAPRLDRPQLDQATAWTRGEVVFDNLSLAESLAEMNRHSHQRIVLTGDAALPELRVSGVFRAGDSQGFADAVARLHGLVVRREADQLVLAAQSR